MLKKTYLYRLFATDKILFAVISVYILGVMWFALRQHEEFPFFLYGMYSLKEPPQKEYVAYQIVFDTTQIRYAKLRDAQRELINSSLVHAVPILENGQLSEKDAGLFKTWLMNYTSDMRLLADNKMQVLKVNCSYDSTNRLQVLKKEVVYTHVAPE